jgi:hypothetical protein
MVLQAIIEVGGTDEGYWNVETCRYCGAVVVFACL